MKQLEIENPCSEKWGNMQGEGKEKLCLTCDRAVIDFQDKSTEEIIEIIEESKERICARVKRSQLNPVKKIAATVLIGGMLLGGSCTPKVVGGHSSSDFSTINMENVSTISNSDKSLKIEGTVFLEGDGEAIGANVTVRLKGASDDEFGVVTEYDGTFLLEGSIDDISQYELLVSYVGYETFSITLEEVNMKKGIEITLDIAWLGQVIVKKRGWFRWR